MSTPIDNRVAQSPLKVIDPVDFYPNGIRVELDIAQWLDQGLILREKAFREQLETFDWSIYKDQYVAIGCSSDAILPAWALLLVNAKLMGTARYALIGSIEALDLALIHQQIDATDFSVYKDAPVMLKGCADKSLSAQVYTLLLERLAPMAKKISFGEACSSVPLWKRP